MGKGKNITCGICHTVKPRLGCRKVLIPRPIYRAKDERRSSKHPVCKECYNKTLT